MGSAMIAWKMPAPRSIWRPKGRGAVVGISMIDFSEERYLGRHVCNECR